MPKFSVFQIVILIVFVALGVLAIGIFAGFIKVGDSSKKAPITGNVILWGTYPSQFLKGPIDTYNQSHQSYSVTYIPVNPATLSSKLAEAISTGSGPDLVILPQDEIIRNEAKLYHIPFVSLSERTFRDTYAQEGELYLFADGAIALPMTIDPLIMYYNRDIFEASGYTEPPKTWDDLVREVPNLTKRSSGVTITQSAVPFGIFSNLNNAKDIISMLIIQAGSPITIKQNKSYRAVFANSSDANVGSIGKIVIDFFTQFVDPTKDTYTWNRSFQNARDQFINGALAVYIGYASEIPVIAAKNPNLNFDVAKVPQATGTSSQATFGKMQAVGIIKATKHFDTAFAVASEMSGKDFQGKLVKAMVSTAPVAPARRDLLMAPPQDILYGPTLYNSAVIARGWYDPGSNLTNPIFEGMIEAVVSGAVDSGTAAGNYQSRLQTIFGNN